MEEARTETAWSLVGENGRLNPFIISYSRKGIIERAVKMFPGITSGVHESIGWRRLKRRGYRAVKVRVTIEKI